ncbi:hypothetical protein ABFV99_14165 [Cytobacillus horneckiae]|uniref:hypothetical protein n=1 Tax=Cytobacillus horneckiae TaxID=549687 RepID=UPI0034CFCA07
MDEKEQELYGRKNEIDTEYERSIIEYRPKVKYEPDRPVQVDFPVETAIENPEDELDEEGVYVPVEKPAQQYEQFVHLWDLLNELIKYSEEEIKDLEISLSNLDLQRLYDSAPDLDSSILNNQAINFTDYQHSFADPESPSNSLIQEIVHSYASDVEGNLELEFYEDLREVQSTLQEGFFLYKESVLKNYLDGVLPEVPSKDEELTRKIDEAVKGQKEWFHQIDKNYKDKESIYYESLKSEYGTPEFFKVSKAYTESQRPYEIAIREEKSVQEMMSLIDEVLNSAEDCTGQIKYGLVEGSDIVAEEVMKVIENQGSTKEEVAGILKMAQLSLKLQVNKQIEDKKQYRDVLSNINNLSRKKRSHDELLMALELRNNMYLKTYDMLQNLESPSKEAGVEAFLNQVAGGLSLVQEQYDAFLRDTYLMHVSEYEIRKEKIAKTLEKENAREGYALVVDHL